MSDCTILIYTFNRPHYLRRCIEYWSESKYKIIIADGSEYRYQNIPGSIKYRYMPGTSVSQRINYLISEVTTKFAVFTPDDDFLGQEALKKSLNFLKNNPDYSSVQGRYLGFYCIKPFNTLVCQLHNYDYALNYHWNDNNYADRLIKINDYKIMHYCYSLVKSDVLKRYVRLTNGLDNIPGNTLFEPLMAYAIAITGKIKTEKYFYCARQIHEQNWGDIIFFEDFIENGSTEYKKLIDNIVIECMNEYQVNENDARNNAINAGETYVNAMKMRKREEVKNKSILNRFIYQSFKIYSKAKRYVKSLLQIIFIIKRINISLKTFDYNNEYYNAFLMDWKKIESVIYKIKI